MKTGAKRKTQKPPPDGRVAAAGHDCRPPTAPGHSTTLIAVVGISPAILTETVWALAQGDERNLGCIPDEVVVITTLKGRETVTDQLLTSAPECGEKTIWQCLRRDLLGSNADTDERLTLRLRLIEEPEPASGLTRTLEDIRDRDENLAAAEFILNQVRQYTDTKDRQLIASLAGGRKTMSALLHAAFSHLARPKDRLTHILVDEPFDDPTLRPRFFFPTQPAQMLTKPDGRVFQARNAKLELAEVPFAPLRVRFPDIAGIPTRFRDLVQMYSDTFQRDASEPAVVEFQSDPPRVIVNGKPVALESERQQAVLRFLFEANQKNWLHKDQIEAAEIFKAWHGYPPQLASIRGDLRPAIQKLFDRRKSKPGDTWIAEADSDTIKRPLSFLRRELEKLGSSWVPPKRDLRLPPFRLGFPS